VQWEEGVEKWWGGVEKNGQNFTTPPSCSPNAYSLISGSKLNFILFFPDEQY